MSAGQGTAAVTDPAPLKAPDPLRQSSIARFDNCALSLLLEQQSPSRQPSNMAARGNLFHTWVSRVLTIMRATGETTFNVDQGLELLLEVVAQRDVPDDAVVHLPMKELQWLRVLVTRWCGGGPFAARRIIAVEERLYATVKVPDGKGGFYDRQVTGRPDVIVADPPYGVIVVDWKSGWAPPSKLQEERDPRETEHSEKLSDQGYAQQVIYGLLILSNYPSIDRVTLREAYVMAGEYREATIDRYNLERVLDVLGAVVAQIDAAFEAGPDSERWIPTAGTHCAMCPAPRKCPLKDWEGIPTDPDEALTLAREWIVAGVVRKERLPLLKGWVDANGPVEIDHGKGRRMIGWPEWNGDKDAAPSIHRGRGPFQMYEPDDAPESPWDERLAETLRAR